MTVTIARGVQHRVGFAGYVVVSAYGQEFQLNTVASDIWLGLSQGATKDQVALEISNRYGMPLDIAADDLDAFLEQLRHNLLIDYNVSGSME